jgi:hypothetical protein
VCVCVCVWRGEYVGVEGGCFVIFCRLSFAQYNCTFLQRVVKDVSFL